MLEGDPRDGHLQNLGRSKDTLPLTGLLALQGRRGQVSLGKES